MHLNFPSTVTATLLALSFLASCPSLLYYSLFTAARSLEYSAQRCVTLY